MVEIERVPANAKMLWRIRRLQAMGRSILLDKQFVICSELATFPARDRLETTRRSTHLVRQRSDQISE
jgi:hypothetical protein